MTAGPWRKDRQRSSAPNGVKHGLRIPIFRPRAFRPQTKLDQAACFRFLRHPISPNTPRPVAKSGSAAGSGVSLDVVSEDQVPGVRKILADGADQARALVGAVPAERLAEVGRDEGTGDAEQRGDNKPDGSLEPGWRNLAITPATKPMMIVQTMLMGPPQVVRAGNASGGTWFRRSSPDRMRSNDLGLRHVSALVRAVTLGSLSAMIPLPLSDDQLKVVIDYAGFVPRRLRRQYLKEVAAKLYFDRDVERAVDGALEKLDEVERSKVSPDRAHP